MAGGQQAGRQDQVQQGTLEEAPLVLSHPKGWDRITLLFMVSPGA